MSRPIAYTGPSQNLDTSAYITCVKLANEPGLFSRLRQRLRISTSFGYFCVVNLPNYCEQTSQLTLNQRFASSTLFFFLPDCLRGVAAYQPGQRTRIARYIRCGLWLRINPAETQTDC